MLTAPDLEASLGRLQEWFATVPAAAVALSGGVDSSLVAFLSQRFLGVERTSAYVAVSPSLKSADLAQARGFCRRHGIVLEEIETGEVDDPNYAANPVNRCFFCKSTLYSTMVGTLPAEREIWILNGTNLDDLGDWRPGLKAADRARVRSPLSECGIDKEGVRGLARRFNLDCWDRPASPCLASRVPYGQPVTRDKLRRIEAGEMVLQQLGFPVARVRHVESRARIEVPTDRLLELAVHRQEIERRLTALGFAGVDIDAEGFVSGKLNRSISR